MAKIDHFFAIARMQDILLAVALSLVAIPMAFIAILYLKVNAVWPKLAPLHAWGPRSNRSGSAKDADIANSFLSRPLAEMPPIDPPATQTNDPGQSAHDEIERRSKRSGSKHSGSVR